MPRKEYEKWNLNFAAGSVVNFIRQKTKARLQGKVSPMTLARNAALKSRSDNFILKCKPRSTYNNNKANAVKSGS
jgi:hypothetical protein